MKRRKLQKTLGVCANGDPVNVQIYKQLKTMGYHAFLISEALRRTNNDPSASIQLMSNPNFESEVLISMVNKIATQPTTSTQNSLNTAITTAVANLSETAAASLPGGSSSIAEVINAAANNGALGAAINEVKAVLNQSFSEDRLLASTTPSASEEEIQKSKKAYDTLAKDIHSEAEYIDLSLMPESTYLDQYKTLLSSLG